MRIFLRLIAALVFLLILSLGFLLWPTFEEKSTLVSSAEVLKLLEPFSWVHPNSAFESVKDFSLRGKVPFQRVESQEDGLFDFDAETFLQVQKATSFREAQLNYFNRMGWDPSFNHYSFEAPHMKSWGALPYPPIHDTSGLKLEKTSSAIAWASDPDYERELDRVTGHELTQNESVSLVQNGRVVEPIVKVISDAKKFVFVNVLSLVCDASTEPVIHALEERAQSGVDVRVILNKGFAALSKPCLQRMRDHQIQIVTAPTHSSYYVNDQGELMLGAESMARMFFQSDGYNFLDRDLMISIKGPVATDVLKNFITVWDKNRVAEQKGVKELVSIYLNQRESELKSNTRARDYTGWMGSSSKNLCRFAEQMPDQENRSMENLLVSLAGKAKQKIFLSGVKFDADSPLFKTALNRASEGIDFNYLGNGWEGGDGELTLYLDELIRDYSSWAPFLRSLRNWDVDRVARKRAQASAPLSGHPHVQLWAFYSFLHYKLALFDEEGVWVGSANPDWDSVTGYDESGVFCLDKSLALELEDTTNIDLSNSIPVSTLRH